MNIYGHLYDWELKLMGHGRITSTDPFYSWQTRRFRVRNAKRLAYIQMKIENPDITPEYLGLTPADLED